MSASRGHMSYCTDEADHVGPCTDDDDRRFRSHLSMTATAVACTCNTLGNNVGCRSYGCDEECPECSFGEETTRDETVSSELARVADGVEHRIDRVERCLLTGGPSWSAVSLTEHPMVFLTVAFHPSANTYDVWTTGASWSGVSQSRLSDALDHMARAWRYRAIHGHA